MNLEPIIFDKTDNYQYSIFPVMGNNGLLQVHTTVIPISRKAKSNILMGELSVMGKMVEDAEIAKIYLRSKETLRKMVDTLNTRRFFNTRLNGDIFGKTQCLVMILKQVI